MANVFFRKGQTETAHNIYSEVVDIWNRMLESVVKMEEAQTESTLSSFVEKPKEDGETLGLHLIFKFPLYGSKLMFL